MNKPVIIQSDNTLLLEVDNPDFENARDEVSPFAELEKSPEHIHTYRITPLSLWNAAASGLRSDAITETLKRYSRYEIPEVVLVTIREQMKRYGLIKLTKSGDALSLFSHDSLLLSEIVREKKVQPFIEKVHDEHTIGIKPNMRGHIKQALIKIGYPVEDMAGYEEGDPCPVRLRDVTSHDHEFIIRDYQRSAMNAFYKGGGPEGGEWNYDVQNRGSFGAGGPRALDAVLAKVGPLSITALLATIVLLFAFQGRQILAQPLVIAMLAVPIALQVFLNSGLAYLLNRRLGVAHCAAAPSALIGASNFFELAVAAAITLFGLESGAALATVVGVLVEVPLMLLVVAVVNRTRGWYERGATRTASP